VGEEIQLLPSLITGGGCTSGEILKCTLALKAHYQSWRFFKCVAFPHGGTAGLDVGTMSLVVISPCIGEIKIEASGLGNGK
jgi:hypothetical protein